MKDKPKIVKMLREEEKLGRFQSNVQSAYEELEMPEELSEDVPEPSVGFVEDDVERIAVVSGTTHEETKKEKRRSGIDVIGDISWGTHFCQFYQTKEDLIDILVPYFKAGLENNEFCMWVTSEPLHAEEAKNALTKALKNLDDYIKKGQIEILDHTDWYTKSGRFEADKVLQGWVEKEKEALKRGFEGLRLTGNTFWLEKEDWKDFADYEAIVNDVIDKYKMLAICSYSLDKCSASDIIDVVVNHQFAIIRKKDKWEVIESSKGKKLGEELKESEIKWRSLVKNAPNIIMTLDRKGTILFINHTVSGFAPDQVIGKNQYEFIQPEHIKVVKETIEHVFKTGTPSKYEIQGTGPDGTISWYETHVGPVEQDGKTVAVTLIVNDITEKKISEFKVYENQKKFQSLVETTSDFIWEMDINGIYTYCSPQMERLWGLKPEQMIGKTPFDLLPSGGGKQALKAFSALSKSAVPFTNMEAPSFDSTGRVRFLEISGVPFFDIAGKLCGYRGITRDITERKKAEEKIKQQNIQLKKLDHIKTDFLNVTSHELRTPMAAMKGYLQMLSKQRLGNVTPEQKNALEVVLRNTNRLDNLIQEILDVSQLESGTMKFIPEKTDISKMIEEVTETVQPNANVKNIKINMELEEVPELVIDQQHIKQAIMNLVDNAIKFSSRDSIINLSIKAKKDNVLFEVQDFGRGMPKKEQKKIFERFYQIDSSMDRKFGGVGLGLAISRDIVLVHGGKMWVNSTVGKGSTFGFTLPVKSVINIQKKSKI